MKRKATIQLSQTQYFGGKSAEGTIHKLINQIPKHQHYVAGFTGLDAIRRFMLPSRFSTLIEINRDIVDIWRNPIAPSLLNLTLLQQSFFNTDIEAFYLPTTFLYLDPPYHPETRTSNHKYPFELTISQHERLLDKALSLNCMIMISCYDCELYRRKLKGWRRIDFEVVTRGGTLRTETVYMNYPVVDADNLHDTRYVGHDKRVTEKNKKRLQTIHRKIEVLDDEFRAKLFNEFREKYPNQFAAKAADFNRWSPKLAAVS